MFKVSLKDAKGGRSEYGVDSFHTAVMCAEAWLSCPHAWSSEVIQDGGEILVTMKPPKERQQTMKE